MWVVMERYLSLDLDVKEASQDLRTVMKRRIAKGENAMFILGLLTIITVGSSLESYGSQTPREIGEVRKAANRFVAQFQRTLDFKAGFEEVKVSTPIRRLGLTKFFGRIGINENLIRRTDDATLERLYVALMNVHYLGAAYFASLGPPTDGRMPSIPADVKLVLKDSRFASNRDDLEDDDRIVVNNEQELQEYIELQNCVADRLRRHLSPAVFYTQAYKSSIAFRDAKRTKEVIVLEGCESFGITNTPIYVIQRDLFVMHWVKENGRMRLLNVAIGD